MMSQKQQFSGVVSYETPAAESMTVELYGMLCASGNSDLYGVNQGAGTSWEESGDNTYNF